MSDPRDENRLLLAAGWQQGTMFDAQGIAIPCQDLDTGCQWKKQAPSRPLRPEERLILTTQACDMLSQDEASVEALLCKRHMPADAIYRAANSSSARYFLVDPDAGLVAYAAFRVLLKKRSLTLLHPIGWIADEQRHRRFIRWLARRYDRPALPGALHNLFEAKVSNAIASLRIDDPGVARALDTACREWRVNEQTSSEPPFDVHLLVVLNSPGLRSEEADAIAEALQRVRDTIDPEQIYLHADVRRLAPEQISWAEVEATIPLFLEPYTYNGEEGGAEPLPRS